MTSVLVTDSRRGTFKIEPIAEAAYLLQYEGGVTWPQDMSRGAKADLESFVVL